MTPTSTPSPGRRVRNMRDKRERIFRAAADLFAQQGFEAVSTSQVADRADVAAGTVFRYASSKSELLLMVLNGDFRAAIDAGVAAAAGIPDTTEAILAMIGPVVTYVDSDPGNGCSYQRELLFGVSGDRYREEGLALVGDLEGHIAQRLVDDAGTRGLVPDPDRALLTARMIFGVTNLAIARHSTHTYPDRDTLADVRTQISVAVAGHLAVLDAA
ncbi:TetR/AcrR family transcriptional regulator [Gordonia sp. NPDC003376]